MSGWLAGWLVGWFGIPQLADFVVAVGVFCVYVHSLMERRERMSMRIVDAGGMEKW